MHRARHSGLGGGEVFALHGRPADSGSQHVLQTALHAGARVGVVQWVASQAVAQSQGGHALQVLRLNAELSLQGRKRTGGTQQRELGTQAIGAQLLAQPSTQHQHVVADGDLGQSFAGFDNATK